MVSGKGGLSIKDYPFAFSLAVLLFPPLLSLSTSTDSTFPVGVLFSIVFIGGMLGSILTITNPFGNLLRYIYIWTTKSSTLPELRRNNLLNGIIDKSYDSAIRSPSISFESDKIVGMFYFVIILSAILYRLRYDDQFTNLLALSETEIVSAIVFTTIGLIGILLAMIFSICGVKSISHLGRIKTATVLFATGDIVNISILGDRVYQTTHSRQEVIEVICNAIGVLNPKNIHNPVEFGEQIDDTQIRDILVNDYNSQYNRTVFLAGVWKFFIIIKELTLQYKLELFDVTPWFFPRNFFKPQEMDEPLTQLQTCIDARDWVNANIKTLRIINRLEEYFTQRIR